NRDETDNVIDGDPSTSWSTERYYNGTLRHEASAGMGTGLYLDAAPRVAAKAVEIRTPTPGFPLQVYVADSIQQEVPGSGATTLTALGWQGPVGASSYVHGDEKIALALHGGSWRYYLLWLTALPPGRQLATIEEVALFR